MTNQSRERLLNKHLMHLLENGMADSDAFRVTSPRPGAGNGTPHTIKLPAHVQTFDSMRTTVTKVAPNVTISYRETLPNTELDLYKGLGWNVWKRWKMWRAKRRAQKLLRLFIERSQKNIEKHCESLMLTGTATSLVKYDKEHGVIDWDNINTLT